VILEAFAKYLHAADPTVPASSILARWLWERLTNPPETLTDRVLRSEVELQFGRTYKRWENPTQHLTWGGSGVNFVGASPSGKRLIKSLYDFASSYEQQKWSRWVHGVKATDFNKLYNSD
jgi:hypothetical protein